MPKAIALAWSSQQEMSKSSASRNYPVVKKMADYMEMLKGLVIASPIKQQALR